ncbi:MAG: HNH endonuclease [Rhodocyclales bacterium]|nr:HNH endonuclease [Rhodocyclales bacterium]
MSLDAYKKKLTLLNINRTSPHKICMLLAVLDLARSGALSENRIEYSPSLLERYARYFAAVRGARDHPNPYYPFFHLKGKLKGGDASFWHAVPLPGRETFLDAMTTARRARDITENISHIALDPELFCLLKNPAAVEELADTLAIRWFDRNLGDLHSVVDQEKRISRYECRLRKPGVKFLSEPAPPEYVRSPAFRRVVTELYDYRCAATGLRLLLNDVAMVEAAHIRPFSDSGDDDPRNGLALTPDMHWAMDAFLIAPGPDYKWHVTRQLDTRIPDHKILTDLDGKTLFLPREQRMYPRQDVLEWRLSQLD